MTIARSVRIMGIINVTPDSFSDGGSFFDRGSAFDQARLLIDQGADILDVGGESTRPYAEQVSVDEELHRVIPVIESIRSISDIPISIDTSKAEVARQALAAGADIINDVTALRKDPAMIELVKNSSGELIIMHMQGTPGTMQDAPHYDEVVEEVMPSLENGSISSLQPGSTSIGSLSTRALASARSWSTTCSFSITWSDSQSLAARFCWAIPGNGFWEILPVLRLISATR